MLKLYAIFLCLMCTSGCASTLDTVLNRNVSEKVGRKRSLFCYCNGGRSPSRHCSSQWI